MRIVPQVLGAAITAALLSTSLQAAELTGTLKKMGIRNFWLIKCQRCKEENLSQRII